MDDKSYRENTLADTPPAYGKQKMRIFIVMGVGEIHKDACSLP